MTDIKPLSAWNPNPAIAYHGLGEKRGKPRLASGRNCAACFFVPPPCSPVLRGSKAFFAFKVLLLFWLGLGTVAVSAREVVPLNSEWKFAFNPQGEGCEKSGFDDASWAAVGLPHTWNAVDGQSGSYARGNGWYRRKFSLPAGWKGRRVFLDVGAASLVAGAWVNGRFAGEHGGGFTRFRFDITGLLNPSGENVLAMRVNNDKDTVIPLGGDFSKYGGLYRDVSLVAVGPAHIALRDFGSPGVYLTTGAISAQKARVDVRTVLENDGEEPFEGMVRVTIRDAGGRTAAEGEQKVRIAAKAGADSRLKLEIANPKLWNGMEDPYLYQAEVELLAGRKVVDSVRQPLGLRTFAVSPDKGFSLNGKPLFLRGVNLYQDRQDKGYAISREDQKEDIGLIKELGANFVRLAIYPHSDFLQDLCDQEGLVVLTEIPFIGWPTPDTAEFRDNSVMQLRELIRQYYNRPSVIFWGLGNETASKTEAENAIKLLKELQAVAKQEDPGRPTVYASHHPDDDPRNQITDLIGYNKYFGWYNNDYAGFGKWADNFHRTYPDRPLGMTEFGAGASIYQHEENPPPRGKGQSRGPWHPEEWQSLFHENAWSVVAGRPYLWCALIWHIFDLGSSGRNEGDTVGRNDKGLVTFDRKTRKDAFYWYKANWTDGPLVHITSKRHSVRFSPTVEVKIYSNCDQVGLWVNGEPQGVKHSTDRKFLWSGVALQPGPNRIYTEGRKGDAVVTDSCGWTLTKGEAYRPPDDPRDVTETKKPDSIAADPEALKQ